MIAGAAQELLGDTADLATDVGPVIDREGLTRSTCKGSMPPQKRCWPRQ
jgi:delta 1-pyrroline-5-carboxylate dehydrogenase